MLDASKTQESDSPAKIIKANDNSFPEAICFFFYFTKSLENSKFSSCLKLTNITTVFKKGRRASKNNYYRLVSVLPIFSEIFERLLSRQILEFFDSLNFNVVLERVMLLSTAYY